MEVSKSAVAGTLESSDCLVSVEPGSGSVELELESVVLGQFGRRIREVVYETLDRLDVKDVYIKIVDKGALDCTLKARIECAVYRSQGINSDIPWGGAIR